MLQPPAIKRGDGHFSPAFRLFPPPPSCPHSSICFAAASPLKAQTQSGTVVGGGWGWVSGGFELLTQVSVVP